MTAPDILANMATGWNRNPVGVALGAAPTSVSAALWSHDTDRVQEVWAEPEHDRHIISLMVADYRAEMHVEGRVSTGVRPLRTGMVQCVRAGERPRAVTYGRWRILHLYVPVVLINTVAEQVEGGSPSPELVDPLFTLDPVINRIGREVVSEMHAGLPLSSLRVELLGQDLAIHLIRRWSDLAETRLIACRRAQGGLAPWQVRRVVECVEAHLVDDIYLAALAQLVDLSPNHFCTAFRISLGEPPHRYLVRRRIERSKEMLADSRLSVTDVALAVGFGSSAHFATAFRKEVGTSPSAYRRDRTT